MIANRHGRTSLSLSLFSPAFLLRSLWGSSRPRGDVTSTVAQLAKRKKRASSTSSRLLRGVFLRNVAVSRIVGRISRISTVYPLPREFVVLFYPRPSRKRCITRRFLFFYLSPGPRGVAGIAGFVAERTASLSRAISTTISPRDPPLLVLSSLFFPSYSLSLLRRWRRGGPKIGAGQRLKALGDSLAMFWEGERLERIDEK